MKVELLSKQTIKPSSPIPQSLRTYRLSFMDQLVTAKHTRILFYYPNNIEHADEGSINQRNNKVADDRCERLKTSLSKALTYFYPLAGKVKDNAIVECNDEGVEFCEAHVHGFLEEVLKQPDNNVSIQQFVPDNNDDAELGSGFLLKVQVNLFDCGGLVVGVSLSHKIADASTISLFMKALSCITAGCINELILPNYTFGSLFPFMEFPTVLSPVEIGDFNGITKRFVFVNSKITKLKAKAASKMVEQPTRVEAVLALVWKCATIVSRTNLGITKRTSMVNQAVNIRKRLSPPLPEACVGNFVSSFTAELEETNHESTDLDSKNLVFQLRKGLEQFSKEFSKKLEDRNIAFWTQGEWKKIGELVSKKDIDFYCCTSWCRFGFYEADFGWGKPNWVSIPSVNKKNVVMLMDSSDGKGIEARVNLSPQDMALVESNHEMLEFACINPSII